jgi:hypothetical protein
LAGSTVEGATLLRGELLPSAAAVSACLFRVRLRLRRRFRVKVRRR